MKLGQRRGFFSPQSTINSFSLRASIYSNGKRLKYCKRLCSGVGAFSSMKKGLEELEMWG